MNRINQKKTDNKNNINEITNSFSIFLLKKESS